MFSCPFNWRDRDREDVGWGLLDQTGWWKEGLVAGLNRFIVSKFENAQLRWWGGATAHPLSGGGPGPGWGLAPVGGVWNGGSIEGS